MQKKWPSLELLLRRLASKRSTRELPLHSNSIIIMKCFAIYFRKNINCSIEESLERFRAVCEAAKEKSIPVRGSAYVLLAVCVYSETVAHSIRLFNH